MNPPAAYDLAPVATLLAIGGALALAPFGWAWWRAPARTPAALLRALSWAALFLTFDLVLFGAFTRLADAGLGCPDWPGCYGHSSPVGAAAPIAAAQAAMPTGPVSHEKAWIEMTHRYLAMGVGGLILLGTLVALLAVVFRGRSPAGLSGDEQRLRRRILLGFALALAWVCAQGAFGALTVTMKLYPAIVTLHLLGGIGLVVILAVQTQAFEPPSLALPRRLRLGAWLVAGLALAQIALGGWVSTNYAVLACTDFPTCQGQWWPPMDPAQGFAWRRPLGAGADGGYLPFAALTAIHVAHRVGALVLLAALGALAWRLLRSGATAAPWGRRLAAIAVWQLATGLSNVVLGWPLLAAIAHTGGATALAAVLAVLLARSRRRASDRAPGRFPAPVSARTAS